MPVETTACEPEQKESQRELVMNERGGGRVKGLREILSCPAFLRLLESVCPLNVQPIASLRKYQRRPGQAASLK